MQQQPVTRCPCSLFISPVALSALLPSCIFINLPSCLSPTPNSNLTPFLSQCSLNEERLLPYLQQWCRMWRKKVRSSEIPVSGWLCLWNVQVVVHHMGVHAPTWHKSFMDLYSQWYSNILLLGLSSINVWDSDKCISVLRVCDLCSGVWNHWYKYCLQMCFPVFFFLFDFICTKNVDKNIQNVPQRDELT